MTGIGEKIIVTVRTVARVIDNECNAYVEHRTIQFPSNMEEQLEALVEQHIREMSAEDVMRIRWPNEKNPE